MATKEYGVRDLRNSTAKVLAAVAAGDQVFLTNRGRRVAELRPVASESDIERLLNLADPDGNQPEVFGQINIVHVPRGSG